MKKEIDLRKFDGKAESAKIAESANICRYLGRDYETISTWDQLIPMMQEIGDDFIGLDGGETLCDADLIYEHDMHCLLHKDVHYVRNKVSKLVDYINKFKRTIVHGSLYRLTVENLYEHKELRDALENEQIYHTVTDAYVWISDVQVFSFIKDTWMDGGSLISGYSAEFCNELVKAGTISEIIEKLYECAGDIVEPKIVFEAV